MSGRVPEPVVRWGGWGIAAVLAVAVHSLSGSLERANESVEELRPLAERTAVRDRLIGTRLSELRFQGPEGRRRVAVTGDGRSVVWLVDPRECANCLADLSGWRDLTRGAMSVTTVLVGVGPDEAARIRGDVDLPGNVALDPEGERAATLGVSDDLPSLFLVLDERGTVLMTEARRSATSCDWSFSGQVAALTGRPLGAGLRRRADAGP